MYKSTFYQIVIFLFSLCSLSSKAQEQLSSSDLETATYQYYLQANWQGIIDLGEKALIQNIDYYYLRLRIGIAYYNQKKFALAIPNLQKALLQNNGEDITKEYLYLSYIFCERYNEAALLTKSFSKDLLIKYEIKKQSTIKAIFLEGGIKATPVDAYNNVDKNGVVFHDDFEVVKYFQFALYHSINNRFSFTHAFTFSNQGETHNRKNQNIITNDFSRRLFPTGSSMPDSIKSTRAIRTGNFDNVSDNVTFYQYFLQMNKPLKNNFSLSPAIHLVYNSLNYSNQHSDILRIYDTTSYRPPTPTKYKQSTQYNYDTLTGSAKHFFQLYTLELMHYYKSVQWRVGLLYTDFNYYTQIQNTLMLNYNIKGKGNVIVGLSNYNLFTNGQFSFALAPTISIKPTKRLNLFAKYFYNNFDHNTNKSQNKYEANGLYLNNIYGTTKSRFVFSAEVAISKFLSIYAIYTYENNLLVNVNPNNEKVLTLSLNYAYHGIFAGIRISAFNKIIKSKITEL
jgi:hypothetical protein